MAHDNPKAIEQAKRILEQRKRSDPLQWFIPTPTQEQFLRRDTVKDPFILVGSLNRGGKSAITMADLAMMLRGIHPYRQNYTNLTIAVFAPTRMQAANVIAHKLFDDSELMLPDHAPAEARNQPMIPAWEIDRLSRPMQAGMRVPKEVVLKNGNRALFSWTGADDQDAKIAGLKLDAAYIDEEAGTPRLFAEIASRLADALSDKNRPGLGYFVWAYTNTRYNDAYENFKQRSEEGVPGHRTFIIMPGENPAVTSEARKLLAGTMDADQAKIRMEGGGDAGALVQIYHKQWGDARHILPSEYVIDPTDNLWVGYDPGVDHPMGMLVCAINKDMPMRLNAVQAWMYRGETIEEDANKLHKWLRGRKIAGFVYDTNLKNKDRGGGQTVLQRFKDLLLARGIDPMAGYYQSKKNHAPGITMMRHYLDPNPQDRTVPPMLVISKPTDSNGTGVLRQQLLKYRGKESTKFTGAGGVVKKDDELCFAAGTPILMADGSERPIESIAVGDMVMTPLGPRPVLDAAPTGERELYEVSAAGRMVRCTGNHPFLTQRGFICVDALRYEDNVSVCISTPALTPSPTTTNAGSLSGTRSGSITGTEKGICCTDTSGSERSDQSQTVTTSTIRTTTPRIIAWITWSAWMAASILVGIWLNYEPLTRHGLVDSLMLLALLLPLGTALLLALSSTLRLGRRLLRCAQSWIASASIAASRIRFAATRVLACVFAPTTANLRPAVQAMWTMWCANAPSAGQTSLQIATCGPRLAPAPVAAKPSLSRGTVYNLTVADAHCYIAGGMVVSNCDCIRYLTMQRPSYNPKWACGYALDIATQRVANLDANDNIPVRPTTMNTPAPPRFDFSAGKFYSRSRDRKRGGWQVVGL